MFLVSCRDGSKVFELAEEALDEVAIAGQEWAERGNVHPPRHRLYVGPGSPILEGPSSSVAVVGAISKQDVSWSDRLEHVGGAAPVVGLAVSQLQGDGQSVGIHQGVDLGLSGRPANAPCIGLERRPERQLACRADPLFDVAAMLVNPERGGSTICTSPSHAWDTASKMRSQTPILAQRGNLLAQVVVGPYRSGMSAQGDPVLSRQSIPFSTLRSSARGTPRGLFGSNGCMIDHSKSDNS